jgi:hypothetical protein
VFHRHGCRKSGTSIKSQTTMKTTTIPLLCAMLTGTLATAQEPAGQRPPPPPHLPPLLAVFDTDHDGVLSAEEIKNASAVLAKLDKNGDGQITKEEMRPPRPDGKDAGPPPNRRPLPPVIAALDKNKDGTISADELKNASESLKQLDTNGDGELSPDELRPQGPPPPPEGQDGDGPPPEGPPPAPQDGQGEPPTIE